MAPNVDLTVISLLCAEDESVVFDEVDTVIDDDYNEIDSSGRINHRQDWSINDEIAVFPGLPSPVQSEEFLTSMFTRETKQLPAGNYLKRLRSGELNLGARNEAVDWIFKVQAHNNFGPLCTYLAVNYLDRFLSTYESLKGMVWKMKLLAVACLKLAVKVGETDHSDASLDLQIMEPWLKFEPSSVGRMEILVLGTLQWSMQSVTPFSFLDHFLYKIYGNDQKPRSCLIAQAIELIMSTIKEVDFLEFWPSDISAAVAICVATADGHIQRADYRTDKAVSLILGDHFEKERLVKCVEMIKAMSLMYGSDSVASIVPPPQSPVGVLDASLCLSFNGVISYDSTPVVSSAVNFIHKSPVSKRRKLLEQHHYSLVEKL